jgi:hypothetical protein
MQRLGYFSKWPPHLPVKGTIPIRCVLFPYTHTYCIYFQTIDIMFFMFSFFIDLPLVQTRSHLHLVLLYEALNYQGNPPETNNKTILHKRSVKGWDSFSFQWSDVVGLLHFFIHPFATSLPFPSPPPFPLPNPFHARLPRLLSNREWEGQMARNWPIINYIFVPWVLIACSVTYYGENHTTTSSQYYPETKLNNL